MFQMRHQAIHSNYACKLWSTCVAWKWLEFKMEHRATFFCRSCTFRDCKLTCIYLHYLHLSDWSVESRTCLARIGSEHRWPWHNLFTNCETRQLCWESKCKRRRKMKCSAHQHTSATSPAEVVGKWVFTQPWTGARITDHVMTSQFFEIVRPHSASPRRRKPFDWQKQTIPVWRERW